MWTFHAPLLQKTTPAALVTETLYSVLGSDISKYTYVDFCAGGGGPTPFIEQTLNAKLRALPQPNDRTAAYPPLTPTGRLTRSAQKLNPQSDAARSREVKFFLTDLHPHVPDWTEASKRSANLSFISEPVDAAKAPINLIPDESDGKPIFRLFSLAFHHFEDDLAKAILRNSLQTSDGFAIFELQHRTFQSLLLMPFMGILLLLITPFYFWRSPGHLFFTYIIPIVPFVVVFDGFISSLRTRTVNEIQGLMSECGSNCDQWRLESAQELHTWPIGYMSWVIGRKS